VQEWLANGRIARAEMHDAEDWHARKPMFWAVVVAPWVLVQEVPRARRRQNRFHVFQRLLFDVEPEPVYRVGPQRLDIGDHVLHLRVR
jgi:hypothetical protein